MIPALATLLATLGALAGYRPPPPPEPPQIQPPAPQMPQEPSSSPPKVITPGKSAHPPSVERWRALVAEVGPPVEWTLRTMRCESRGDPNAISRNGRYRGLMQIEGGPLDPESNLTIAAEMYRRRGRQPWPRCG